VTGYIPVASQSGSFLNNTWHINEMQMISRKECTSRGDEVLVVGDSIVFGGNALDQSERVGEQLDALFETRNVYAIADGSWTFKNSVNYLASRKDDLLQLQDIVFVLNSRDFEGPPPRAGVACLFTRPCHLRVPLTSHAGNIFLRNAWNNPPLNSRFPTSMSIPNSINWWRSSRTPDSLFFSTRTRRSGSPEPLLEISSVEVCQRRSTFTSARIFLRCGTRGSTSMEYIPTQRVLPLWLEFSREFFRDNPASAGIFQTT
jgi:hypothetical protein